MHEQSDKKFWKPAQPTHALLFAGREYRRLRRDDGKVIAASRLNGLQ